MVTVTTTNGKRLDGYSYSYEWHEVRWLVIPMNDMRLDKVTTMGGIRLHGSSYYYTWHEVRWSWLFLRMA
jgi:hypothetical protein